MLHTLANTLIILDGENDHRQSLDTSHFAEVRCSLIDKETNGRTGINFFFFFLASFYEKTNKNKRKVSQVTIYYTGANDFEQECVP